MTTRRKGAFELGEVIETPKTMPLDARQLVRTKEEMLDPDSFPNGYKGMITGERMEGKLWMLMDHNNPTLEASWKVIGPYDDTALDARVTALEEGSGSDAKVFVAEYNVTTAQEIMDYMDSSNEPYAPIVIKRDTNYHTVETMFKRDGETVILRSTGTINGEYYMFTYAVTGNVWAISTDYGFQRKLESGTNLKTVGGQSLLGSGDIPISGSQVQADWNEADTASAAYIQNKPTIPEAYDDTAIQAALAGKADASSLANVATSGSYNDLGDKPTIPPAYDDSALAARVAAVETTLPNKANTADLANVATSGSYNDLGDKPTIPAAYDDTALASRVTALEGRTDADTQADWNEEDTSSPAFIQNKPTIPAGITVDAAMSDTSENPVQNKVVLEAITDAVDVVDTAVQGLDTRVTALNNKIATVRYKVEMDDAAPPESMVLKGDNEAALQPTMTFAGTSDTLEYSAENENGSYAITMPSKAYVDGALADKQDTLVSGTNIKTLNSMSLLGNGNISIEKGAGIPLDANNLPSANVIMQMVNDEALVYIDKWMIERANYDEEHTFWIHTRWGDYTRTYKFLGVEDLDAPLVLEEAPIDNAPTAPHLDTSTTTQYSSAQLRTRDGGQAVRIVVHDDYARLEIAKGNTTKTKLLYGGNYIVDKPEGSTQLGNVVQIGTLQRESGDEVGIFEFYYRTSALPNTTAKQFTLLPLLENYTVNDFIDATGMTSNGIFIGNGRTDNDNRLIVQQFSKNNKHFTIRTYQDFSGETALMKIKFIGTKTTT